METGCKGVGGSGEVNKWFTLRRRWEMCKGTVEVYLRLYISSPNEICIIQEKEYMYVSKQKYSSRSSGNIEKAPNHPIPYPTNSPIHHLPQFAPPKPAAIAKDHVNDAPPSRYWGSKLGPLNQFQDDLASISARLLYNTPLHPPWT